MSTSALKTSNPSKVSSVQQILTGFSFINNLQMRLINEKLLLPPALLLPEVTVPLCDAGQGNPSVLLHSDSFGSGEGDIAAGESPAPTAGPALSTGGGCSANWWG